jgi:hypothetical protein
MTADDWASIRERAERLSHPKVWPANPWRDDPWGMCRARWLWWGRLPLWPFAWAFRRVRAAAFARSPRWRRRRASARLRLAQRAGQRARHARVCGDPAARWHVARAVTLWRQARALAAGEWC